MKGFKDFLMQGNLVDLAVAVIIGTAFSEVVKSFTAILMGIIGRFGGQPDFSKVAIGGVLVGPFVNAIISFAIVATVVYFLVVKPVEHMKNLVTKKSDEPAEPTTEELLVQIRDLLASKPQA